MGRKPKQQIKYVCEKCGKEPEPNKEMSNENWKVFDNKPCAHCGGNIKIVIS
jgi:DNA-directed RNA polymerase subunit RPC12/RpoP